MELNRRQSVAAKPAKRSRSDQSAIGVTFLFITRDALKTMWHRLMDAVDPKLVDRVERAASTVAGAQGVHDVRVRWLGRQLQAELHIVVDEDLPTRESHAIAEAVRHKLHHAQPHLALVNVHVDPRGHSGVDHHASNAHHGHHAAGRAHGVQPQPERSAHAGHSAK